MLELVAQWARWHRWRRSRRFHAARTALRRSIWLSGLLACGPLVVFTEDGDGVASSDAQQPSVSDTDVGGSTALGWGSTHSPDTGTTDTPDWGTTDWGTTTTGRETTTTGRETTSSTTTWGDNPESSSSSGGGLTE